MKHRQIFFFNEQSINDAWNNFKRQNKYTTGVPKEEEKEGLTEKLFQEIMAKVSKFDGNYKFTNPKSS